jgi:CheY-like chemotaxis protein
VTLLVVEDEVLIRLAVSEDLRSAGFTVIEVSNADQALAYLAANSGVDVVFSDIRLPGSMDGIELMRALRSRYPSIKIVLTSGHWSLPDVDCQTPVIRKPYLSQQVIARIRAVLA